MITNQVRCDLCNSILKENEISMSSGIIRMSNKPKAKSNIIFTFEGTIKKGDLCFDCARQLRDYVEKLKLNQNRRSKWEQ